MQKWSGVQIALAAVVVVLFAGVAVLAFIALDPDQQKCVSGEIGGTPVVDAAPEEALGAFVANNPDLYPSEGWEVESTEGDSTVFTNDDGGDFTVTVTSGAVTAFERCES
jgi:hypothetical protein